MKMCFAKVCSFRVKDAAEAETLCDLECQASLPLVGECFDAGRTCLCQTLSFHLSTLSQTWQGCSVGGWQAEWLRARIVVLCIWVVFFFSCVKSGGDGLRSCVLGECLGRIARCELAVSLPAPHARRWLVSQGKGGAPGPANSCSRSLPLVHAVRPPCYE